MQDIEMQTAVTVQATSTTKKAMSVVLSLCLGLALFVAMTSTDAQSSMPAQTELAAQSTQLAGVIAGYYKCIDKYGRCSDKWCNDNCNHVGASFCPPTYCKANSDDTEESKAAGGCTGGSIEGNIAKKFGGGKVCCPAGCGSCGGKGCANRPGGKSECCVGDGKTYGVSAAAACGNAPCKLAAAATQLAGVTLPKVSAADCANVQDWNFLRTTVDEETGLTIDLTKVTQNNLGGMGPNKSDKQEIRYSNVADEIDLVLTVTGAYTTNPTCKDNATPRPNKCVRGKDADCPKAGMECGEAMNGLNGRFGQVNVKGNTKANLKFTLVNAGTDTPVDIAPEQKVFFAVFDLDNNGPPTQEVLSLTTKPESQALATPTEVKRTGPFSFQSTTKGDDLDNPTDPLKMTDQQMKRAVWVTYKGTATWGMTFGETGNAKGKGGRNLLFAGRAQGACPPGPVAPPTGACKVGIEGMIKGGGKVCCPQKCDGSGGAKWVKHEDAPNHCGGPNCDKSANGAMKGQPGFLGGKGGRTQERYDNCCIGKPVSGGTSQKTIDAPYGLVKQRNFCKGSGLAEPLIDAADNKGCINKLSKLADRL